MEAKEERLSIDHHLSKSLMHLWHWKKSRQRPPSRHSSAFFSLEAWANIKSVSEVGVLLHVEVREGWLSIEHRT